MPVPLGDPLAQAPSEKLVLSLPPDPALARLTRLATLHFLRQNGIKALEARRRARAVEQRSKTLLRTAALRPSRGGVPLDLVLTSGTKKLEVVLRRGTGRMASLLQVRRNSPTTA